MSEGERTHIFVFFQLQSHLPQVALKLLAAEALVVLVVVQAVVAHGPRLGVSFGRRRGGRGRRRLCPSAAQAAGEGVVGEAGGASRARAAGLLDVIGEDVVHPPLAVLEVEAVAASRVLLGGQGVQELQQRRRKGHQRGLRSVCVRTSLCVSVGVYLLCMFV